jgi:hypothetical protein
VASVVTSEFRVFQIFYNEETRSLIDPDFEPLDNMKNERPDWYEYWPIRNYLRRTTLNESAYYGFLSPSFLQKTRLSGKQVRDFAEQADGAEIIIFSPFPCQTACFHNVFEHGDFFHSGLYDVAMRFFATVSPGVDLDTMITHSRNSVFCNFFLARRSFWNRWLELVEQMFELAETKTSPLYSSLTQQAEYFKSGAGKKRSQMKIFILERAASFLLATARSTVAAFPPFKMPLTLPFRGYLPSVVMLDSLKIAFSDTGDPHFLDVFREERAKAIATVWPGRWPRLP